MINIKQSITKLWLETKQRWFPSKENNAVPLDQISRFYQTDFYQSLDESLKSAFYDGPLGGLDSRVLARKDVDFLSQSFSLWQHGRNLSCAIYGEKGTGLSTLLNIFIHQLKQQNQAYKLLTLEKRLTDEQDVIDTLAKAMGLTEGTYKLDDFIQALSELPSCVIVLDNLHFLVQRTLGAQAVIDCLGAIILATRGHHFWLLGAEEQTWRRLCYGYRFENLISHQHHIANFTDSEMRDLLIKRFAYAGFHTINDIATDTLHSEKSPINDIAKRSKGCVELGFFYCLNNLTYGTKPQSLLIMPAQEIDMGPLKKLNKIELFTLAEISTHGQLSVKEHAGLFRMSTNESKMTLEHLRVLGIVDQGDEFHNRDTYSLKLIISAVVIRYLISMNYLY